MEITPEIREYAMKCCRATQIAIAKNVRLETNFEVRKNGRVMEKWDPIISQFARLQSGAQVKINEQSILNEDNIVLL